MSEYKLSDEPLVKWEAADIAGYLKSKGLEDFSEFFLSNGITGQVLHRLEDNDLKEMGVTKVGDRLKIMEALETLKKAKTLQDREKVIWEGTEILYFSSGHQCFVTCCGCCPQDPSEYKLMSNNLEIKTQNPCRCGPIRCCCGHSYDIDNVDVSGIVDADVKGVSPPCLYQICCCGAMQEHIHVETAAEGEKILRLPKGEGQAAARKIKNQVETMQMMERS